MSRRGRGEARSLRVGTLCLPLPVIFRWASWLAGSGGGVGRVLLRSGCVGVGLIGGKQHASSVFFKKSLHTHAAVRLGYSSLSITPTCTTHFTATAHAMIMGRLLYIAVEGVYL